LSGITLEHEGDEYRPYEPGQWWQNAWASLTDDEAAARRLILDEGTFLVDGDPMPESRARFERAKILGTHNDQLAAYDPTEAGPDLRRSGNRRSCCNWLLHWSSQGDGS
jgi:hypothetical protein